MSHESGGPAAHTEDRNALPQEVRTRLGRWAEASGCRLLVVFGSSARGGPGPARDVDLAVSFPELPPPEERLALIGRLQDIVHPRDVDIVFLRPATDPVLRFEVFRTGVPLHEAREGLFVDEVVRALALYEDAIPFRRALRASLLRTVEEME